jgi:hypothetical protein
MSDQWGQRPDVVGEPLGDELVLYDPVSRQAHALDRDAAAVWQALDGGGDESALAARSGLSVEQVIATLARLDQLGLLAPVPESVVGSLGRRQLLKRGAQLAAAGIALPVITSLIVPAAAAAASSHATGTPLQDGKAPPPGATGVSYETKSAGGNGYYVVQPQGKYYAPGGISKHAPGGNYGAGKGMPISNNNKKSSHFNSSCEFSSGSVPCKTYYAGVPGGSAVCASYGSPYVCTGSKGAS